MSLHVSPAAGRLCHGSCKLLARRAACSSSRSPAPVVVAGEEGPAAKPQAAPRKAGLSASTATLAATAATVPTLIVAPAAQAQGEYVDLAVNSLIQAVKATGGAVKVGIDGALTAFQYAKQAYDQAAPVVKDAAETAAPYAQSAFQTASDVARPVVRAAVPLVEGSLSQVEQFLERQGLNAKVVLQGAQDAGNRAGEALTTVKPGVDQTVTTLSATDPTVLAEYALGLAALYYLGPPLIKGLFGSLRGYAGDLSPAAALDAVSNDANVYIIDLRSEREKESAGIPDLPRSDRLVDLEYAEVADRKLRGQLRNVTALERTVTVLQIAALKKVSRGTRVLLMDRTGSQSAAIAKELTRRGFKKTYVIQGGFSGWTSSKLQTKGSSSVANAVVLPFGGGTIRTGSSTTGKRGQLALPGGR